MRASPAVAYEGGGYSMARASPFGLKKNLDFRHVLSTYFKGLDYRDSSYDLSCHADFDINYRVSSECEFLARLIIIQIADFKRKFGSQKLAWCGWWPPYSCVNLWERLAFHGFSYVSLTNYDLLTMSHPRNINSCHNCNRAHISNFILIYFKHRKPHTNMKQRVCI